MLRQAANDTYVAADNLGGGAVRAASGVHGQGPAASTIGLPLKATAHTPADGAPKTARMPEMGTEVATFPRKSNAVERDRARNLHQAYSAPVCLHCLEQRLDRDPPAPGGPRAGRNFKVPD